ncbi:hypothetical protein ACSNOI_32220 [Actinomadura kijaniata]|uniref:hypothetical protein n=1 Tax=Actinomadura kijaniata TaxID=46161 RepID=UPI003F1A1991
MTIKAAEPQQHPDRQGGWWDAASSASVIEGLVLGVLIVLLILLVLLGVGLVLNRAHQRPSR